MAGGTLRGITIEIGGNVSELSDELGKLGARSRETGRELAEIERALKFNPDNVVLLAQKEKYASEQAATLRQRLDAVGSALASGQVERGSKAYDRLQREVVTAAQKEKYASEQAATLRQRLDAVGSALASGQVERGSKAYDRLQREVVTATDKLEKMRAKASEARSALDRLESGAQGAAAGVSRLGDTLADASRWSEDFKQAYQGALMSLGEDALDAAKDVVSAVYEQAAAYDSAASRIEAAVGGAAEQGEVLARVGRSLYSDGWGESMDRVTESVIRAREVLGDLSEEDLSTVTRAAMTLESVFGSDVSESLRGVDVLMTKFGLSAQESADLMVAGAQRGLDYTDELGDNLAEYGGRWAEAGVSATKYFSLLQAGVDAGMVAGAQRGLDYTDELGDNLAEYGGRWAEAGVSATKYFSLLQAGVDAGAYSLDKVGDYLNEFLTSLSDGRMEKSIGSFSEATQAVWESYRAGGSTALDVLDAVIGELGSCTSETERRMEKSIGSFSEATQAVWESYRAGGSTALDVLDAVIGELGSCTSETERLTLSSELWSSLGEDNAMGVILAMADVADSYGDAAGAAEQAASSMEQSFTQRAQALKRKAMEALTPVANVGLGIVSGLIDAVDPVLDAFSKLDDGTQKAILGAASLAAGMPKVVSAYREFRAAAEAAKVAQTGLNMAVKANAFFAVLTGVILLVEAVGDYAASLGEAEERQREAERAMTDLEDASRSVSEALGSLDGSSLGDVSDVAEGASESMRSAADGADGLGESLRSAGSDASALASGIADSLSASRDEITSTAEGLRGMSERMAEVGASTAQVRACAATIAELRDTEGLSEAQQARLNEAVRRFNELTGSSITVVDSHNGKLSETPAKIDAICDAYAREAQVAAITNELTRLYDDQARQMGELETASKALGDAYLLMWDQMYTPEVVDEFLSIMGMTREEASSMVVDLSSGAETLSGRFAELYEQTGYASDGMHLVNLQASDAGAAVDSAREAVGNYSTALSATNESIDGCTQRLHEVVEGSGESTESLDELAESTRGTSEAAGEAGESLEGLNDGLEGALKGCRGLLEGAGDLSGALSDASKTAEGAALSIERVFDSADREGADISAMAREVNAALKDAGVTTDDLSDSFVLLAYQTGVTGDELVQMASDWQVATDAQRQAEEAAKEAADAQEKAAQKARDALSSITEEAPQVAQALESAGYSADGFIAALERSGSSVDEFRSRWEGLADAANPLASIEQETGVYTWQMAENLQANIDAVSQWGTDITELYSRCTNEQELAFAQYVESMGADNAEFLQYLLYDADVSFPELAAKYAEAQQAQADAAVAVTQAGAEAAERTGVEAMEAGAESLAQAAGNGAEGATDALAQGIEGGAPKAASSASVLGEETMEALMGLPEEMRSRGEAAGGFLAIGIAQGSASIPAGVQALVDLVTESLTGLTTDMAALGEEAGSKLAASIAEGASGVSESAGSLFEAAGRALAAMPSDMAALGSASGSSLASALQGEAATVGTSAQSLMTAAARTLSGFPAAMGTVGREGGRAMASGIGGCGSNVAYACERLTANAAQALSGFVPSMGAIGSAGGQTFAAEIQRQMGASYSAASSVANAALSGMASFNASAYWSGREMGGNFAAGVQSQTSAVASAANSLASSAAAYLHHTTPDVGPLKDDDEWGGHMGENIASGMLGSVPEVERAALEVARAMSGARSISDEPPFSPHAAAYGRGGAARASGPAIVIQNMNINARDLRDVKTIEQFSARVLGRELSVL